MADISTQEALETMGDEGISEEISTSQKQPNNKRPLSNSPSSVLSQTPVKKTRGGKSDEFFSSGSLIIEDDDNMKDLVKQVKLMSSSMRIMKNTLMKEIKALSTRVENIESGLLVISPPIHLEEDIRTIKQDVSNMSNKLDNFIANPPPDTPAPPMDVENTPPNDSTGGADKVSWKNQLNKRKLMFYKYIKNCEHHAIYVDWQNQQPPFTPARFLPSFINNEPQAEYDARKKQSDAELACFMEILSCRASSAKEEMDKIDGEVMQRIHDANVSEAEKTSLIEAWTADIKKEEERSKDLWKPKKEGIMGTVERQANRNIIINVGQKVYVSTPTPNTTSNSRSDSSGKKTFAAAAASGSRNTQQDPVDHDQDGEWETVTSHRNRRNRRPNDTEKTQPRNVTPGLEVTFNNNRGRNFNQSSGKGRHSNFQNSENNVNHSSGRGRHSGFQPRRPPYRRKNY